jgi:hypothetical protein
VDGSNIGWWVPTLPVAVPLLLLLMLYLLARLESWMFSPDERAEKVARLLDEVETPDDVEAEVTRLLSEVPSLAPPQPDGSRVDERHPSPRRRRVDRSAFQEHRGRRERLRRALARASTTDPQRSGRREV